MARLLLSRNNRRASRPDDLSIGCKIRRAHARYFATLQGLVLSRSSSRAFRRKCWQFLPRPRPRHSALLARYSRPTNRAHARSHARTHGIPARMHARTHADWYTRVVSRDTRERPCIYFAYIRHGFEHGHTEHNLGESINGRRCERRERVRNETEEKEEKKKEEEEESDGRAKGRAVRGKPGARTHVTPLSVLSLYIRSRCDFLAPPSAYAGLHFAPVFVISRAI